MDYKARFYEIMHQNVKREGIDKLLEWMEKTDFFTAPASTRFHCACEEGLVQHSLSVYDTFMEKQYEPDKDDLESVTLCTLLHDLCKAQYYKVSERNVKNEQTGKWEKQPYYAVDDQFPYGHGEKSVFLIERFVRLKPSEAAAIRWHMGGFDDSVKAGSFYLTHAYEKYPLAVKVHLSDLESTYLKERGTSAVNR